MRVALVGPLHPWRGGIAQYLGLLGESLAPRAEVRGFTFTRQYPDFLFPGASQRDPAAEPPRFPVDATLDSIGPWSWRRTAAALERFAPGLVILKWWLPFFGPGFASSVGPVRARGSRVMLVCDNLVPHEKRPFDDAFSRWMLRNSDGYLIMSESVERDLDRLKPGAPRRRVLHPLYAQFDRGRYTRESARAKLGLTGEVALFFGYEHRFEAYLPKEKRVLGYFALPVQVGDEIVAAIDLKTDRVRQKLLMQKWTWVSHGSARSHKRSMAPCMPAARYLENFGVAQWFNPRWEEGLDFKRRNSLPDSRERQRYRKPVRAEQKLNLSLGGEFPAAPNEAIAELEQAAVRAVVAVHQPLLARMKDVTAERERPEKGQGGGQQQATEAFGIAQT
jgi:hypothetical protein